MVWDPFQGLCKFTTWFWVGSLFMLKRNVMRIEKNVKINVKIETAWLNMSFKACKSKSNEFELIWSLGLWCSSICCSPLHQKSIGWWGIEPWTSGTTGLWRPLPTIQKVSKHSKLSLKSSLSSIVRQKKRKITYSRQLSTAYLFLITSLRLTWEWIENCLYIPLNPRYTTLLCKPNLTLLQISCDWKHAKNLCLHFCKT